MTTTSDIGVTLTGKEIEAFGKTAREIDVGIGECIVGLAAYGLANFEGDQEKFVECIRDYLKKRDV
ncbi:MAG: hypothetical protein OXI24_16870 [Candidatus Poribacteria bacterium]|nr:hypothetical protein [Candidatus Poribacteria bacterium]